MSFKKECGGFTLIEILTVVGIISLLASVVFASLNEARERARVTNVLSNLKQMEKGFYLLADYEEVSSWWNELDFGEGTNPDISVLAEDTERLGRFLPTIPDLPTGINMGYDNDEDTYTCGSNPVYTGVNIHVRSVPEDFAEKVSQVIDGDTNTNCGRVRWDPSEGGSMFYLISDSYLNY